MIKDNVREVVVFRFGVRSIYNNRKME